MADPRKDPRYKALFNDDINQSSVVSDYLKSQAAWNKIDNDSLIREENEIQIEEKRRGQKMRTKLSEVLAAGGEGSVTDKVKPVLAEYGDVDSLIKFENQDRLQESGEATRKQQRMNAIFKIAEVHPELASQMWNANFGEMGMMTPEQFEKKPEIKAGAGMLYHVEDGKIVVDYKAPEKSGEGKTPASQIAEYPLPGGKGVKFFDIKNPEDRRKIEEMTAAGELERRKQEPESFEDFRNAQNSAPEGPGLWDRIWGEDEEEEAPTATPMPSPVPRPTATPAPKRRIVVKPKGISQ